MCPLCTFSHLTPSLVLFAPSGSLKLKKRQDSLLEEDFVLSLSFLCSNCNEGWKSIIIIINQILHTGPWKLTLLIFQSPALPEVSPSAVKLSKERANVADDGVRVWEACAALHSLDDFVKRIRFMFLFETKSGQRSNTSWGLWVTIQRGGWITSSSAALIKARFHVLHLTC